MGAGGFIHGLTQSLIPALEEKRAKRDELTDEDRKQTISDLEGKIKGIQADDKMPAESKSKAIDDARRYMIDLHHPHEGKKLLTKLHGLFGVGEQPAPASSGVQTPSMQVGGATIPGSSATVRTAPRTISDILAMPVGGEDSGVKPLPGSVPHEVNGKYFQAMIDPKGNISSKPMPEGWTPEAPAEKEGKPEWLTGKDGQKPFRLVGDEYKPLKVPEGFAPTVKPSTAHVSKHDQDLAAYAKSLGKSANDLTDAERSKFNIRAARESQPFAPDRLKLAQDNSRASLTEKSQKEFDEAQKNLKPFDLLKKVAERGAEYTKTPSGPGDVALMLSYFQVEKPDSGFRLTSAEQNMINHARGWADSAQAMYNRGVTGTLFSDDQRKIINDIVQKAASHADVDREKYLKGVADLNPAIYEAITQKAAPAKGPRGMKALKAQGDDIVKPVVEKTATGPNGHKIALRGGKWVDAESGKPI